MAKGYSAKDLESTRKKLRGPHHPGQVIELTSQELAARGDSWKEFTERSSEMRTFETGATRDSEADKYDYEGFLSPQVLEAFGEYMHKHREQADGELRDSDNWQKGIPKTAYMKSMWRHFMDLWKGHRGVDAAEPRREALCALMFNVMGYLHEELKVEGAAADNEFTDVMNGLKDTYSTEQLRELARLRSMQVGPATLNEYNAVMGIDEVKAEKEPTPYDLLIERVRALDPAAAEYLRPLDRTDDPIENRRVAGLTRLDEVFDWSIPPQGDAYWRAISKALGERQ